MVLKQVQEVEKKENTQMHYPIYFKQEDFQNRLMKLKQQFIHSQDRLKNQLKATFYFEDETVVEFPSYQNQWRKEILNQVTVQMTLTSDGQLHYAKPNRKRMQSFLAFPLTRVTKVEVKPIKPSPTETLKKLFSERLDGVWDNLTETDLKPFLGEIRTISLKDCLYETDFDLFQEALVWKKPFVSYRLNGRFLYKVEIETGEDGICRAWLFEEDEDSDIEHTYLILNSKTALYYPHPEHTY